MIYLLGSILLTSYLTLFFKVAEYFGWNTFQVIVSNYITCVITGAILRGSLPFDQGIVTPPWLGWAIAMGATFICLFNVIGFSARRIGVAVTAFAYKLSVIIPFLFSIYLYHETPGGIRISGLVLALISILLACYPSSDRRKDAGISKGFTIMIPLIILVWSGLLDTSIKFVEQQYLDNNSKNDFLLAAFSVAASTGIFALVILAITGKQQFSSRSMAAGIMLGIPNYFSIWCLLRVFRDNPGNSAAIIAINNVGIVLVSAVAAWLFFKEKISLINWSGIALATIAIMMMA